MSKYGYVPFWVLVTNLSFGQISRFYEALTFDIRSQIAKVYKLKDQDLRVVLKILNGVRNLCAHSNRVYCSNLSYVLPEEIGITGHKIKVDVRCSKKFGSTLYCLKYVVSANKFSIVIDELNRQIDYLKHHLHTISIKDVLKKMGISSTMVKEFGIKL